MRISRLQGIANQFPALLFQIMVFWIYAFYKVDAQTATELIFYSIFELIYLINLLINVVTTLKHEID